VELAKFSSFIAYELTEVEYRAAYTYNEAQIAGIQNQLAAAAEEFLNLPLDEDDTDIKSIKRRSYLQGQISICKYLLSLHDAVRASSLESQEGNNQ
jgi:hypothetical protein